MCSGQKQGSRRLVKGHQAQADREGQDRRGPQGRSTRTGGPKGPAPGSSPARRARGPNTPCLLTSWLGKGFWFPAQGARAGPPVGGAPGRWGTRERAAACR